MRDIYSFVQSFENWLRIWKEGPLRWERGWDVLQRNVVVWLGRTEKFLVLAADSETNGVWRSGTGVGMIGTAWRLYIEVEVQREVWTKKLNARTSGVSANAKVGIKNQ
jgi:hypothetical protein